MYMTVTHYQTRPGAYDRLSEAAYEAVIPMFKARAGAQQLLGARMSDDEELTVALYDTREHAEANREQFLKDVAEALSDLALSMSSVGAGEVVRDYGTDGPASFLTVGRWTFKPGSLPEVLKATDELRPQMEAAPGFRHYHGVQTGENTAITVMQFDTLEHLNTAREAMARLAQERMGSLIVQVERIGSGQITRHV